MLIVAADDGGDFVVSGSSAVIWMLVVIAVIAGGVVTAAKGRWGWLAVGLLFGGLIWPLTAFLAAAQGSLWQRNTLTAERSSD